MADSFEAWGLCPDYQAFLREVARSADLSTRSPLPAWPSAAQLSPRLAEERLEAMHLSGELHHVEEVFGLERVGLIHSRDDVDFWPSGFLEHAYPIATGHGGDPIIQIRRGRRRGAVLLTDHDFNEEWWLTLSGSEEAAEEIEDFREELDRVGWTDFASMTTDQFVDFFTHPEAEYDGAFVPLADTFADFYAQLCAHYGCAPRPA